MLSCVVLLCERVVCEHVVLVCEHVVLLCEHVVLLCEHVVLVCEHVVLVCEHVVLVGREYMTHPQTMECTVIGTSFTSCFEQQLLSQEFVITMFTFKYANWHC